MNILTPYSWLKERLDTNHDWQTLVDRMSLVGNEAEDIIRPDALLSNIVVGKVHEVLPHPNADKLKLAVTEVEPGKKVQVVCGGVNLEAGQTVAVALPGAVVMWHGEEAAEIKEAQVRGQDSHGMICAAEEIGFPKLATPMGIWDLTGIVKDPKIGEPLAQALELESEIVMDFEVTTNRPDAMSIVGQAREGYAGDLGTFEDPFLKAPNLPNGYEGTPLEFKLEVHEQELCPRYLGLVLDVEVGPSPWWMQKRLLMAGAKPINNVVDVTNYVRLEYGQPLHAFDYANIGGGVINVRRATEGEKFVALDETEHELTTDMLVIADAEKPVAIGGVMGGLNSGVTADTETIILEAAAFHPISTRKTARALNLYSDSQTLYEKGLSSELPAHAMARAVELLKDIANAQVRSDVHDSRKGEYAPLNFTLRPDRVNELVGIEIDSDVQRAMLERLGFRLSESGDGAWKAEVPFWRDKDIEAGVDLTEEIARLYGYHNLPSVLPSGIIPRRERDELLDREYEIMDLYSGGGWTQLYSNSFEDPKDVERAGMDPSIALRVLNPLSEEQACMRTSLVPSMLRAIVNNQTHAGVERLFELSRVYLKREGDLPEERSMLMVSVTDQDGGEDLFRHIKGALDILADRYHFEYELDRENLPHWLHAGRGARILVKGKTVGVMGEIHPLQIDAFGLDLVPALLEMDLPSIEEHLRLDPSYVAPGEFPVALRDIAMLVDEDTDYGALESSISGASKLVQSVELFDLYRGSQIEKGKKSVAVHVSLSAKDRTLTSQEVDEVMGKVEDELKSAHQATIRE